MFEDAADWIVGCAHADGSTKTTITCGEKTRREIPTETLIIDLDADGHGTPSPGGGGADPFTISAPVNPLDARIAGYLMMHEAGSTQNSIQKAVRGARINSLVARLKVVGRLGPDKLWRCATGPQPPAKPSQNTVPPGDDITPPEQVIPESHPGGGENRESGGVIPVIPTNGNQGGISTGISSHLKGNHPRESVPGITHGNRLQAQESSPPPPRRGLEPYASIPKLNDGTFFHGDGKMKGMEKMVKHEESCPRCFGTGTDCVGKPCTYVRPPVVQEEEAGIKRWDDESKTWVDAFRGDPQGRLGFVHLHKGWTVRDGDPRIHMPLLWNESEEAWEAAWQ